MIDSHRGMLLCALLVSACNRGSSASRSTQPPNAELAVVFEQDQAERSGPIDRVDMNALVSHDSARRVRVRELEVGGALQTAPDFYHAAVVFQHGLDSLAYAQAHAWAKRSEEMDSTRADTRWLVAATWDRYQMSRSQPQWFGTQTDRVPRGTGPVVLYTIDTTRITDAERMRRGVGTLAQLRARLDTINKQLGLR